MILGLLLHTTGSEREKKDDILLFVVGTPWARLRRRNDLAVGKHCGCLPQSPALESQN